MNKLFVCSALLVSIAAISCRSTKPIAEVVRENTRVETRTVTKYLTDTVFFELPAQTAERVTRDTTSFLENDFAYSTASILSDGSLFHDLKTKPQKKPLPYQKPVITNDSVVYVDREIQVPVPVEKKLTTWQKVRIDAFWPLIGLLLAAGIWIFRKPILSFARRFI